MADITAADIKKVREITGAGMSDVKAALTEAEGDHDKAVEILRLKGAKDVGKRESRSASNGFVALATDGTTKAVIVEINCETDFVAKTEQLQTLGADIAQHALSAGIGDADALAGSSFGGGTVKSALDEANAALGEKIEVRRVALVEGAYVASYLHKTSPDLPPAIGVLVALSADSGAVTAELGKQLAQHVAAFSSRFLSRDDVPAETVEAERRLAEQMAREEGKPDAALPKIVEGRVNGFFKDFVLLEQAFVMDNKKSVQKVLEEAGVTVTAFSRFKVGQA